MKLIEIEDINTLEENKDIALCLGFFDGFHLGHKAIFNKALAENKKVGVMSFDVPPKAYLNHNLKFPSLMSLADRAEYLDDIGIDYFYILRASDELFNMTALEFVDEVLKRINPKKIYCGDDYSYGRFGSGKAKDLKQYFDTDVIPFVKDNNKKISTLDIIEDIKEGRIEHADKILGRNYSLYGLVVEGNKVGRTIGFPTANLKLSFNYVLPKIGVYSGYAIFMGKRYKAIISVSTHPSIFELKAPIIEVHFLNFNGNLYGKEINVEFVSYLRDIIKFKSLDELKEQLKKDKEAASL